MAEIVATISPYLDVVREELMERTSFGFAPDRDLPQAPARRADVGSGPRVLFVGFPSDYSLAFLLGLLQLDVRVCGIVTSPGAHPAILGDNALSRIADHLGVPLLRTWRINDDHSRIDMAGLRPEAAVMASFNQIVNAPTLRIPRHGFINVHPSLLPQYRGPEPVYWVIADGAERTGITLHRAVPKVDAGPILAQAAVAVDPPRHLGHPDPAAGGSRLATAGGGAGGAARDAPGSVPDLHAGSYLPPVGHRRLDEAPSAAAAERMVRAGVPNMPAWTRVGGEVAYVLAAQLRDPTVAGPDRAPRLSFPDGDLALLAVSPLPLPPRRRGLSAPRGRPGELISPQPQPPCHHGDDVKSQALSHLPWAVTRAEFLATARDTGSDGACLVFVISDEIPPSARAGYAQLIIAYARANEPVTIDGEGTSTLLITEGGVDAGAVVADRVFGLMRRISLDTTIRAGVAALAGDPEVAISTAHRRAERATPASAVLEG